MQRFTKIFLMVVAMGLIWAISPHAKAQNPPKIGYIELSKIFDEYRKTQDSSKALDEERKEKQAEMEKMVAGLNRLKDELGLLSEAGKKKKQAEIDEKTKKLSEFERESRVELGSKRNAMMREILEEIDGVISEYGKAKNYDLILDDRFLLYHNESMDLTNETIKILNSKYKGKAE